MPSYFMKSSAYYCTNFWQLAIAIAPEALQNEAQLDLIESILTKHLQQQIVDIGYYHPARYTLDELSYYAGRAIIIEFQDTQDIKLDSQALKKMLLQIWAELLKNKIPLLSIPSPGFQKIPSSYPTPFSFSCGNDGGEKTFYIDSRKPPKFFEGCDLYQVKKFPGVTQRFSYIYLKNDSEKILYYINQEGKAEDTKIKDYSLLDKCLTEIKAGENEKIRLRPYQVYEWITANGGHNPYDYFLDDHSNHPLLGVEFALSDFADAGIQFYEKSYQSTVNLLKIEQSKIEKSIELCSQKIKEAENTPSPLFDEHIIEALWASFVDFQKKLSDIPQKERLTQRRDLENRLEKSPSFRRLLDEYPWASDYMDDFDLDKLRHFNQKIELKFQKCSKLPTSIQDNNYSNSYLLVENTLHYVDKNGYVQIAVMNPIFIDNLKVEFEKNKDVEILRLNMADMKKLEGPCDWYQLHFNQIISCLREKYVKRIAEIQSEFSDENDKIFVSKSPKLMQQIGCLRIQLDFINKAIQNLEPRTNIAEVVIPKAIEGIENYLKRPRGLFNSHLSIFSRIFDRDRGMHRARCYLKALKSNQFIDSYKIQILFALFDSKDGATLQKDITKSLGFRSIHHARQAIRSLAAQLNYLGECPPNLGKPFNDTVNNILAIANNAQEDSIIGRFR